MIWEMIPRFVRATVLLEKKTQKREDTEATDIHTKSLFMKVKIPV
jgi:hypothetical protein